MRNYRKRGGLPRCCGLDRLIFESCSPVTPFSPLPIPLHYLFSHVFFLRILFLANLLFLQLLSPAWAAQPDSLLAEQSFDKGYAAFQAGAHEASMRHFEQAARHYLAAHDTSYALYSYKFLGAALIQQERLREFLDYRPQILPLLAAEDEEVPATLTLLGTAAINYGDLALAHHYFDSALARAATLDSVSSLIQFNIGSLYLNQGRLFVQEGDYERALLNYQHALAIFADSSLPEPGRHHARMRALLNIGHVHELQGEWGTALHYNALVGVELKEHPHRTIEVQNLNNMGIAYRGARDFEPALESFRMELALQGEGDSKRGRSLKQLGETFLVMGSLDSARHYLLLGKGYREREYGQLPHPNMAKLLLLLGEVAMRRGEVEEAGKWFQEAQARLVLPRPGRAADALPAVREILFPLEYLSVLEARGRLWEQAAEASQGVESWHKALATYQLADSVVDLLRQSLDLEGSKLTVAAQTRPLFEGGLRVAEALYRKEKDEKWLRVAWHFAEKNRASLLKESILQANGRKRGMVSDSLWRMQRHWSLTVANLRKDLAKATPQELAENPELRHLEAELFASQLRLDSLREKVAAAHPGFVSLLENPPTPSFEDILDFLPSDQSLVEYFYGDSAVYAFTFGPAGCRLHKLGPPKTLDAELKNLRAWLREGQGSQSGFASMASHLHASLIAPLKADLVGDRLVIVPDGPLYFLPFEILLGSTPAVAASYRTFPYLLRDYAISYQFSCGLMVERAKSESGLEGDVWAGFAPDYAVERSGLAPLSANKREVSSIAASLPAARSFLGNSAGKEAFLALLNSPDRPSTVHLACHAKAGSDHASASWIAFSDSLEEDALLKLDEIYHLEAAPVTVVLSACETGSGPLRRGEGAMSLARGFYLSGSRRIVSSMWQVRDGSSAALMERLYAGMEVGKGMDEALQAAVLAYLESEEYGEAYMSPHFWAGFRVTGEAGPVEAEGEKNWIWWILLGGLLLGLLIWRQRSS